MEPYRIMFEPFGKVLVQIVVSRSIPLCWHTYSRLNNNKDIRIISLEKTVYDDSGLAAYRLCIGPFVLTIGW